MFDFFNLRITFDKDLHSCNTDFDIFSDNLHTIPVILEGKQIMEHRQVFSGKQNIITLEIYF